MPEETPHPLKEGNCSSLWRSGGIGAHSRNACRGSTSCRAGALSLFKSARFKPPPPPHFLSFQSPVPLDAALPGKPAKGWDACGQTAVTPNARVFYVLFLLKNPGNLKAKHFTRLLDAHTRRPRPGSPRHLIGQGLHRRPGASPGPAHRRDTPSPTS